MRISDVNVKCERRKTGQKCRQVILRFVYKNGTAIEETTEQKGQQGAKTGVIGLPMA